jgi:uncharacterized HAD superfamily protein
MGPLEVNIPIDEKESFQKFLLSEYNNIAAAHFNTVNTISNFFRYYLLIVTIPVPAVAFFAKNIDATLFSKFESVINVTAGIGSLLIFVVSFCVIIYMINLRFDAILYARVVNGIRRYFYMLSKLDIFDLKKIKVLPITTSVPSYQEWRYFYPVILAFSLIAGFYMFFAIYFLYPDFVGNKDEKYLFLMIETVSISLSVIIYISLSRYREIGYLRRPVIGVDIDGVLNKHRNQFCNIYKSCSGKSISPEKITKIPVQECRTLEQNVRKEDCYEVFNDPDYWKTMPINDDCVEVLNKFKNSFNYRVELFTWRGWPEERYFPKDKINEYIYKWYLVDLNWRTKGLAIKKLTKEWLKNNNVPYDKLTIESGSEDTPNPKFFLKNRFQYARRGNYSIFVEDEVEKAKKLAQICDIVFLINQPYNQGDDLILEKNIIRVGGWRWTPKTGQCVKL